MPVYYKIEPHNCINDILAGKLSFLKQNILSSRLQLITAAEAEIALPANSGFDEEDIFCADGFALLISDALYQRIRCFIEARRESYCIIEHVRFIDEGRIYTYVLAAPDKPAEKALNGKISAGSVGYLPLFRCGEEFFCTEEMAQQIMGYSPHGAEIINAEKNYQ